MESGKGLNLVFIGFISIIIGLSFIGTIGNSVDTTKKSTAAINETVTFASGLATLAKDDYLDFTKLQNSSGYIHISGSDYNVSTHGGRGYLALDNNVSGAGAGTFYALYNYQPSTYVNNGTARTLLDTTVIFFALVVMSFGLWIAWKGLQDAI